MSQPAGSASMSQQTDSAVDAHAVRIEGEAVLITHLLQPGGYRTEDYTYVAVEVDRKQWRISK